MTSRTEATPLWFGRRLVLRRSPLGRRGPLDHEEALLDRRSGVEVEAPRG